ncbi:Venom prothrombin activator oscutarin-C non-catalytic subunit [Trichoplax sp. H2]|nr:Venom prothrombin activator oscutarin-C non-catalytic subunit [Trichoplax sp. H2]|eukprot:RDD37890.1 Venom prothrombin activator oscutarin-C non-catalytic subunit [Trichoplax sp. H2]
MGFLAYILFFTTVITFSNLPVEAQTVECDRPLGLRDGSIKNSQLFSSGPTTSGVAAQYARLFSSSAWCIMSSQFVAGSHYLQIDFLQAVNVTAIEAQGQSRSGATSYYTQYCSTAETSSCQFILENGGPKEFIGRADGEESILTRLPNRVLTRYIRIYPLQFVNNPCMRLEIYGCSAIDFTPAPATTDAPCNVSLGMSDARINDSQIYGEGETFISTTPKFARLKRASAWCIRPNYFQPGKDYLEIDLLRNATLTAIAAQGQSNSGVSMFQMMFSIDIPEISWKNYTAINSTKPENFAGGITRRDIKTHNLKEAFHARRLRIYPLQYISAPCMRLELYGCPLY